MYRPALGLLVLSLLFATPAFARFNADYDDASQSPCGSIDPNRPCYFTGSGYASCTARGTQRCRDCAQLQTNGTYVCVYVTSSGYCSCSDVKQTNGTTSCQAYGACTYVVS
ncbi:MAG TPA: hypothetical protein VGF28_08290 [Thermoanaerobaculia bacterium]|jgi:hypothetical protein